MKNTETIQFTTLQEFAFTPLANGLYMAHVDPEIAGGAVAISEMLSNARSEIYSFIDKLPSMKPGTVVRFTVSIAENVAIEDVFKLSQSMKP